MRWFSGGNKQKRKAPIANGATEQKSFNFSPLYAQSLDVEHQPYANTLNKALEDKRIRNIALTGSYGSGKSSILDAFEQDKKDRIIRVSFSSLGAKIEEKIVDTEDSPDNKTGSIRNLTNLIQKEIVKQILFKEAPRRLPSSKFRRISKVYIRPLLFPALFFAAATELVLFIFGQLDFILPLVNDDIFLYVVSILFILLIFTLIFTVFSAIVGASLKLEKITGGPLTFGLTGTNNYFDEYLDEILYFFETTDYDIVLIEDIDRFKKLYIFESLRQLSAIINSSGQVGKSVRFIYALKDSIFADGTDVKRENGVNNGTDVEDERSADDMPTNLGHTLSNKLQELPGSLEYATNRTKFFDLIIPIVPFLAHSTSRNYIVDELNTLSLSVGSTVVKFVAPELTDMRLIKNIANEFSIFNQKVLKESRIKSLKPDNLFAMIVYKNLFLGDFERIKTGKSLLNEVLKQSVAFVRDEVKGLLEEQDTLVEERDGLLGINRRSEGYGARLIVYLDSVASGFETTIESYGYDSRAVERGYFSTPEFWQEVAAADDVTAITLTLRHIRTRVQSIYTLTKASLKSIVINDTLEIDKWRKKDDEKLSQRINEIGREVSKLQTMSISDLMKTHRGTFGVTVTDTINNEMVVGLLEAGFIDRYFALYTSTYHPGNLSGNAMNFMIHNIDTRAVDMAYSFQRRPDIENLLRELSDTELANPALVNIEIIDYLLGFKNSARMAVIARTIAEHETTEELIDTYVRQGKYPVKLMRFITPVMPSVFRYLFSSKVAKGSRRWDMVNEAIDSLNQDVRYLVDEVVTERLISGAQMIRATQSTDHKRISNLVYLGVLAHVRFKNITKFSKEMIEAITSKLIFEINEHNLKAVLEQQSDLSLNSIRQTNSSIYDYVLENIDSYANLIEQKKVKYSISSQDEAVNILTDISKSGPVAIEQIVNSVNTSSVFIDDIAVLPRNVWPLAFDNFLANTTLKNVLAYYIYLHSPGEALYESIATYIETAKGEFGIEGELSDYEQENLKNFVVACLNSPLLTKPVKTTVANNYFKGEIDGELLVFDETTPVGELLASKVLSDTAPSFSHVMSSDRQVIEEFIENSVNFTTYINEITFTVELLELMTNSKKVPDEVKGYIIKHLENFEALLNESSANALLHFAIRGKWHLSIAHQLILYRKTGRQELRTQIFVSSKKNIASISDAQKLLESMDEPHSKLAKKGTVPKFNNTDDNINLLAILTELGMVSKINLDTKSNTIRVSMKRKW
jgi:hypothetical protein